MADREEILNALFAKLQAATFIPIGPTDAITWVETGRRLKLWGDIDPSQQPAMFLTDHDEDYKQPGRGQPPRRFLPARVWCYARCDGGLVGSTIINTMLTTVENALTPDDKTANVQSLGGLVYTAWIEGTVIKDPGDLDDQALLIVPIQILWP